MSYIEGIEYNQVDFVIKAPRFKVIFSYMDEKGIPFVREYFLRLLKIRACKPEHIAEYFDFSEKETEVALKDLLEHKWVKWNLDGTVGLSNEGLALFDGYSNEPKISSLRQSSVVCNIEFLAKNFVKRSASSGNNQFSLELEVPIQDLSISKDIVKKQFSIDFLSLLEDKTISLSSDDAELYKVDLVEQFALEYFRVTQVFKLAVDSGVQLERNDIDVLRTEKIDLCITDEITKIKPAESNLNEIIHVMDKINDQDTRSVIIDGKLDVNKFIELKQKSDDFYFIGQIYHQNHLVEKISELADKSDSLQVLKWLAPSDIYWSKQTSFSDVINTLIDGAVKTKNKEKFRRYDFRLYLPFTNDTDDLRHLVHQLEYEFRAVAKDKLYLFNEGFLGGNVEIMVLKDSFAIVCYHIKLPLNYDVSLPLGFMTTNTGAINLISNIIDEYLKEPIFDNESKFEANDFGSLFDVKSKISNRGR